MGTIEGFLSFIDRADSLGVSEEWSINWRSVRRDGRALHLEVFIETRSEDIPDQSWVFRVDDLREIDLKEGGFAAHGEVVFSRDHVLLWGYKDLVSQLNFAGPPANREGLIWDLYQRHHQVTGGWIPFNRYLGIHNRLSDGHGVLAQGPDQLLQEYASVLKGSGLEPYFPYPPHPPVRVYGPNGVSELLWKAEEEELSVLVLFDSYIVGTGFSAEPV
ncbi:hypothetical protein P12x_005836 [Tundrisphaera lichenicola]|uniref:hypothetical protein n=1 Tax=Tundrisphaera lichenicola TaxID=2029860 RepID=UPI003EBE720D